MVSNMLPRLVILMGVQGTDKTHKGSDSLTHKSILAPAEQLRRVSREKVGSCSCQCSCCCLINNQMTMQVSGS
jgi:hypothetical protein